MTDKVLFRELEAAEEASNRAVISNDVAEISECISEDWVLVTPEAGLFLVRDSCKQWSKVFSAMTA